MQLPLYIAVRHESDVIPIVYTMNYNTFMSVWKLREVNWLSQFHFNVAFTPTIRNYNLNTDKILAQKIVLSCSRKEVLLKILQNSQKTPVSESLFQ